MCKSLVASLAFLGALGIAGFVAVREAPSPILPLPKPEARVLFAGDMMFDRSVREYSNIHGQDYLLECMDVVLGSSDLVVANLEGSITDNPSRSMGAPYESADSFYFTFPTSTAELLVRHHIDAVSLGNNHIDNFGEDGIRQTVRYLDAAGVRHFGDPLEDRVADIDVKGVPLTFIAYNEFMPWGKGNAPVVLESIADAKALGRVPVVFPHWGPEYETQARQPIIDLAHQFIDAGAAAVVGAHPHVVQNSEVYKGAPIYYSLGNFVFDQYFEPNVMKGLLVELSFSDEGVKVVREIPTTLTRDRRVCPAS